MKIRGTIALLSLLSISCVDSDVQTLRSPAAASVDAPIVVVPHFQIVGSETIPADLLLQKIDLAVSEIRLEPLNGGSDGLAYSTNRPEVVQFDIAKGETARVLDPVILPRSGEYLVSIRVEPISSREDDTSADSFRMNGFVVNREKFGVGEQTDGTPLPLPFAPKEYGEDGTDAVSDNPEQPEQWTPFHYESRRAVFFTFTDVELSPGEQVMTFSFDIRDWATAALAPISKAVRNTPQVADEDDVDVSQQVESTGRGVDALIGAGVVETQMRRTED